MPFSDLFSNENLWFSNKIRWSNLTTDAEKGEYFPQPINLIWSIPLGLVLICARRFLQSTILLNLGYYVGVPKTKPVYVPECPVLEKAYKTGCQNDKRVLENLSKQTDLSVRQIEIWFRKRAKKDGLTDIQRFTESSWHLLVRGSSFMIGLLFLWNKEWFWETKYAWIDWPNHHVSRDIYCYFIFELSIYWHLIFNLLMDFKRKDFWLSAIHHFCTIVLMYFGWVLNFVRIGSLVLLVHDASDPWVDLGKLLVYSKRKRASEIIFVIFIFVWMSTKDGIYPFILLYSTTFEAQVYLPVTKYTVIFFNSFLYILMILHVMWTYMIFEVIINKLRYGELKDVRSDEELESDDLETQS
ncbi:ceramide synthase 5-like [Ruditapes philippinarum]|uniref:ceramide synthase 5-like n=1 Tax=Ruditapes philippinarum TaxID=129788 RepID=UPI00295B9993|nr:ceramide synthase 5-like [Ruditapes philippinarum]